MLHDKYSLFLSGPLQERESLIYGISCAPFRSDMEMASYLLDPILKHPYEPLPLSPLKLAEISLERNPKATLAWLDKNYEELIVGIYLKLLIKNLHYLIYGFPQCRLRLTLPL